LEKKLCGFNQYYLLIISGEFTSLNDKQTMAFFHLFLLFLPFFPTIIKDDI